MLLLLLLLMAVVWWTVVVTPTAPVPGLALALVAATPSTGAPRAPGDIYSVSKGRGGR